MEWYHGQLKQTVGGLSSFAAGNRCTNRHQDPFRPSVTTNTDPCMSCSRQRAGGVYETPLQRPAASAAAAMSRNAVWQWPLLQPLPVCVHADHRIAPHACAVWAVTLVAAAAACCSGCGVNHLQSRPSGAQAVMRAAAPFAGAGSCALSCYRQTIVERDEGAPTTLPVISPGAWIPEEPFTGYQWGLARCFTALVAPHPSCSSTRLQG